MTVITTIDCDCTSPDHHGQPGTKYYVSVMNDARQGGLVAGPFETHREALAELPAVRRKMMDMDIRAPWYHYGTAGVRD